MISFLKPVLTKKVITVLITLSLISFVCFIFYELIKEYECKQRFNNNNLLIAQWNAKCNNYIDISFDIVDQECIIKCLDHLE